MELIINDAFQENLQSGDYFSLSLTQTLQS